MTDKPEQPTQADREASWVCRPEAYSHESNRVAWMRGDYDTVYTIQTFARHRIASEAPLLARIAELEAAARDAIALIDEINERSSSRQFHGINQVLHAKLATIRLQIIVRDAPALKHGEA